MVVGSLTQLLKSFVTGTNIDYIDMSVIGMAGLRKKLHFKSYAEHTYLEETKSSKFSDTIMSHSRSSGNKIVTSSYLRCDEHLSKSPNQSEESVKQLSGNHQLSETNSNNPNHDSESSVESARPMRMALSIVKDRFIDKFGKSAFGEGQSSKKGLRHESCTRVSCEHNSGNTCDKREQVIWVDDTSELDALMKRISERQAMENREKELMNDKDKVKDKAKKLSEGNNGGAGWCRKGMGTCNGLMEPCRSVYLV